MEISIKRWGNGAGLPLSKVLRKHLASDVGDSIEATAFHSRRTALDMHPRKHATQC